MGWAHLPVRSSAPKPDGQECPSYNVVRRLSIYAALGVPEVWRFDGTALTVYVRQANGEYETVPVSPHFPSIPPTEIGLGFEPIDLGLVHRLLAQATQLRAEQDTGDSDLLQAREPLHDTQPRDINLRFAEPDDVHFVVSIDETMRRKWDVTGEGGRKLQCHAPIAKHFCTTPKCCQRVPSWEPPTEERQCDDQHQHEADPHASQL